ncbi:hypothetical protein [Priestia filamentosa]|uniref:hypothetical protein n=1 Tax=Priestia filamentosa TaxID=1402861 RepID=UPI000312077B|nr:hypothetical protein [Priestia filamentosa]MDT3763745.1 MFS transporter [Priestia filamentosa]WRU94169.1 MFS transporter [Priestia filamentosa]SMF13580.1 hypothetical protein SAMN06296056_1011115 [Priestia filamentosa]
MRVKREKGQTNEMTEMCKLIASGELFVGVIVFGLSFIASDYNKDHILTMLGLGIMGAAMAMFGFGLFLGLMDGMKNEKKLAAEYKLAPLKPSRHTLKEKNPDWKPLP